jgi:hypothetical protein
MELIEPTEVLRLALRDARQTATKRRRAALRKVCIKSSAIHFTTRAS